MGWDEIDFETVLIQGMITGGPEREDTVSFADYLNIFSRALDEKMNMLITSSVNTQPTLPNIEFTPGNIRNTDFWDNYSDLINQYWLLWDDNKWYSEDIKSDRANFKDYELDDQYIIDLITQEVFNIISDVPNQPRYKLFRADVLAGIYTIYKEMRIVDRQRRRILNPTRQIRNAMSQFSSNDPVGILLAGSGFSTDTDGTTEGEALQNFNDDFISVIETFGNYPFYFLLYNNAYRENDHNFRFQQSIYNNSEFYYYAENLEGTRIDIDVYAYCTVVSNYRRTVINKGTPTYPIPGDNRFPQVNPGGSPIFSDIDPVSVDDSGATGLNYSYSLTSSKHNTYWPLPPMPGQDLSSNWDTVRIDVVSLFFADINNPSLEFYNP